MLQYVCTSLVSF